MSFFPVREWFGQWRTTKSNGLKNPKCCVVSFYRYFFLSVFKVVFHGMELARARGLLIADSFLSHSKFFDLLLFLLEELRLTGNI